MQPTSLLRPDGCCAGAASWPYSRPCSVSLPPACWSRRASSLQTRALGNPPAPGACRIDARSKTQSAPAGTVSHRQKRCAGNEQKLVSQSVTHLLKPRVVRHMGMEGTFSSQNKKSVHVVATALVETTKATPNYSYLPPVQPNYTLAMSTLVPGGLCISGSHGPGAGTNSLRTPFEDTCSHDV